MQDIAALFAASVAALGIFFEIRALRKQMWLQNFSDYTKRYQEIILHFPESINEQSFNLDGLDPEIRNKTMRYMRAYFDLCSEEYYLFSNKYIAKDAWGIWKGGMEFAFTKPAFRQAWKAIRIDTRYSNEFMQFVDASVVAKNNSTHQ